ncbi:Spo0E like sporulation regulatory protein [Ureibacillus xyleni]|uniref:Spo0E like sporulation regulatory protein n=1 Tax=Ureibacillus xyleni TaxID=614648 RepID=A0A285TQ45_9BACL|nr:aspartyl-phosphate phosphatase Spo0E family protein [Ureibacillus xyleni]SOC25391.1 Spo0E like sporulation regulatory protein [Ureibacillus xyleni]
MEVEYITDLDFKDQYHKLQTRMIHIGLSKGLTHPETIKYSQELDMIMNSFQKISHFTEEK